MIEVRRPHQELRLHAGRRRPHLRRPARPRHRLRGPERVGQDHDHAARPRPRRPRRRHGLGRRTAATRSSPPPSTRSARCSTPAPSTAVAAAYDHLLVHGPGQPHPARAASTRSWRPSAWPGRPPAGGRVLARHGAAARHRGRPPRRPAGPDVRRAGERPRPRGHPVDPPAPATAGGRGPHGARVQPPHERDGPDRRAPRRDRQGPPGRRHDRPRPRRTRGAPTVRVLSHRARPPGRPLRRPGRHGLGRRRCARGGRPRRPHRRRPRGRARRRRPRAGGPEDLAGGGLLRHHRGGGRVPRRRPRPPGGPR